MDATTIAVDSKLSKKSSSWQDWLGIVASVGCAIHCAAMPFVFAYLPTLGLSFLADAAFHKWMALVCFLIAIVAFIPGLRKHGSWIPISIGAVGLAVITYAAFGLGGECCASCSAAAGATESKSDLLATLAPWITPLGGVLLVTAHLMNRRCGCNCSCCGPSSKSAEIVNLAETDEQSAAA